MAATVPGTPSPPTTTALGTDIIVQWDLPYDGGSPVTGYVIRLRHADGSTFSENTIYCDGVNTLTIINTRQCTIPITVITGEPYYLPWGSSVYADLQAINFIGYGAISSEGNGAVILIVADPPVNLQNVPSVTDGY
jgi:hypothetical protein